MQTKKAQIIAALKGGDDRLAIKIAAAIRYSPSEKEFSRVVGSAWEAIARPKFQEQLGRNPEQLIEAGLAALKKKYAI